MINALLMPGAILGQFYLLLCSLNIHTTVRKKKQKDRGIMERKKEKKKGRWTEREKVGKKREACFFFFFF